LADRVEEPRKFMQVLVGPRQVGKTTLVSQLVDGLPADQYFVSELSADGVIASDWLDQAWQSARAGLKLSGLPSGLLCVDEVQKVKGWAEITKRNWDADTRAGLPLKVLLTGSSRLLLQEGLSESLMGRFELHHLGHWSYTEMRDGFGFTPEQFAWFGGYPGAAALINDETRFKDYVVSSIIEASLNQDIFMLSRIDKPALLRQLFDLGLAHSGQIVSLNKMLGQLVDAGNTTTLSRYLQLVDQAGLLAGLNKHSTHALATRASSPKFQVHNMALFSAVRHETFTDAQADTAFWGRVVENAVGAQLINQVRTNPTSRLGYWREGNDEVDFVLQHKGVTVGIEVKSSHGRARGIAAFNENFPDAKTLVIDNAGLSWQTFLATPLDDVVDAVSEANHA